MGKLTEREKEHIESMILGMDDEEITVVKGALKKRPTNVNELVEYIECNLNLDSPVKIPIVNYNDLLSLRDILKNDTLVSGVILGTSYESVPLYKILELVEEQL